MRRHLTRTLGALLFAAALLPLHRLLDPATTGLAGATTRRVAEGAWQVGVWGSLVVLGGAAVLTVLWKRDPTVGLAHLGRALATVPSAPFALACAAASAFLAGVLAAWGYGGLPTSVDEMVQLLHARVVLAGSAGLPLAGDPAAWMIQNSLLTPEGWASVYPPLHTFALAAGHAVGAAWLVGPLATGAMVGWSAAAFARLAPDRRAVANGAGALVALSPFVLLLGGTHLSHTLAGACAAFVLWAVLRARDGGVAWATVAGAGVGAFVCARPWTGLALSLALTVAVWAPAARGRGARWLAARGMAWVLGGLPFAALLLTWNRTLFGDPLRLGYTAAFGPAHGLGLHDDPWGNAYGLREALAYTGADLTQLGTVLLETPVPLLIVVGAALMLRAGSFGGAGPAIAWASAGLAANAVYWHHGIHMGPRLLYETAPAWIFLGIVSATALAGGGSPLLDRGRRWVGWVIVLAAAGALTSIPARVAGVTGGATSEARLPAPPSTPALVFAHGTWPSRVSARLAAAGMRRDSVETALRRNDLCAVDAYARWRSAAAAGRGAPPSPPLDLAPRPGPAPGLAPTPLSPGNVVLVSPTARPSAACLREAAADRLGTVELEPLLWQAPPLAGAPVVVARDLGPAANASVRSALPGRTAYLLIAGPEGEPPRLLPYDEGMELLWGGAAGLSAGGGGP